MQLKTIATAVALALFATNAHAKIPNGIYIISSNVPSDDGLQRALTFSAQRQTQAAVAQRKCKVNPEQLWQVQDYPKTNYSQIIVPFNHPTLYTNTLLGNVTLITYNIDSWVITPVGGQGSGYYIRKDLNTKDFYWGTRSRDVNAQVIVRQEKNETWSFIRLA